MENCKRREFIRMSILTFASISFGINNISAKALQANALNGYLDTNPKFTLKEKNYLGESDKVLMEYFVS